MKNERLQLPPVIYAVPGMEMNIYFDNVFLSVNPSNYIFQVTCPIGRNDEKRWRVIPTEEAAGIHELKLEVSDDTGIIAEAATRIVIPPADAGKGRKIRILMIGDSLTDHSCYPARLHSLCLDAGIGLDMLGTNHPSGFPGICHEGWGGWTWNTFLFKDNPTVCSNPQPYHRASEFVVAGNGSFDFAAYLIRHGNGIPPDIVTIQLGVNDISGACDENIESTVEKILENSDLMLAGLRLGAPDAVIAIALATPGAKSQDAFGANYACGLTRRQYQKNQHYLNRRMIETFSKRESEKLFLIPSNSNLDCENNFPARPEAVNADNSSEVLRQSNGLHPAPAGYHQLGDTYFALLKALFGWYRIW
ncbi:MAG: GDSL-like Lipase/Acylhydrolase [Lentisphaerae bacterium ADurb.Bin242]|nr:MAG: GDSL-like Lipase/Acylhydrolase [Lentisphaerae bacterium ADurb.Bin242]